MIELHTHSLLSDGVLLPTEALRRAVVSGFQAYAITDHIDTGNIERVMPELIRIHKDLQGYMDIQFIPGVEITHVPPSLIGALVIRARQLGARLVLVHGETISEPVISGTNRAAIEAGCDILAHPGLISDEEVQLARDRGVFLEVTGRKGHCLGNGRVVQLARKHNARLVINSDAHAPGDPMNLAEREAVGMGAGLSRLELEQIFANMREIADRCC